MQGAYLREAHHVLLGIRLCGDEIVRDETHNGRNRRQRRLFSLIKKSTLTTNQRELEVKSTSSLRPGYTNVNALHVDAMLYLTVHLGNILYPVFFLLAERLAVEVILGMGFMNK